MTTFVAVPPKTREDVERRLMDGTASLRNIAREFDVSHGNGWTQITAATEGQPHRGHLRAPVPGGRADRRRRPRQQWKHSGVRLVPM